MEAPPARTFVPGFHEEVRLSDGTRVELELLGPEHRQLIQDGFAQLSAESRYRRFLSAKSQLSEKELDYLTSVDGERHFAIGARTLAPNGHPIGLGVARFIKHPEDPHVAEPAVAVVDSCQGKGLGRILVDRLIAAGQERGVQKFEFLALKSNAPIRHLLEGTGGEIGSDDGEEVCFSLPLHDPSGSPRHPLFELLSEAARGLIVLLGLRRAP